MNPDISLVRVFDPLSMINAQVFVGGTIRATAVVIIKSLLNTPPAFETA